MPAAVGMILPEGAARAHVYGRAWFYVLLGLSGVSLAGCMLRRVRSGSMTVWSSLTHGRSLLLFGGTCVTLICAPGCGRRGPQSDEEPRGRWCAERRELYHRMPVTVRFAPADERLAARAWSHLERVDDVFNVYRKDSELGRVNSARDRERVRVSDDLAKALRLSMEVHRLSHGAFDVTVGPLLRLWKGAAKTGKLPSCAEVASARDSCGLQKVRLDGNVLCISSAGLKLDLGGIVKGIAVDDVVAMLKAGGARAALVQVGGETAAFGVSMRGRPHVIGIQHPLFPRDPGRIWAAAVDPGTGLSCSTSGNYQQPVTIAGREFYHIVDPETGRPVDTRTLSVSVVFHELGKNWLADGLSTAGAVMGHEKALPLIEKLGAEALFLVVTGGEICEFKTAGWDGLVRKEPRNAAR